MRIFKIIGILRRIFFTIFTLTLPLVGFTENNVDPRVKGITIEVSAFSIASTDNQLGHGLTRQSITELANSLRSEYPWKMSFGQIQEVSDAITLHFRKHGYKFHYAFIPPQKPEGNIISISISEIKLGHISIANESYFPNRKIFNIFKKHLNKPLHQPTIDRSIRALKFNSAVDFFAYYSRGSEPNSVRLNIRVTTKKRWDLGLSLDNHGPTDSGKNRVLLQSAIRNPLRNFDHLALGASKSYGESDNYYGYLFYKTALHNIHHEISAYASNSVFEIGGDFSNLGLEGDATVTETTYINHFLYSSKMHQSLSISYAKKSSDFSSSFNNSVAEPNEKASSVGLIWDVDYANKFSSQKFKARWYSGHFTLNEKKDKKLTFRRLVVEYQYYRRFSISTSTFGLESNLRFQRSDKRLPSFERRSLAGANGVRGFESGQFSADDSESISLSVHFPSYNFYGKKSNFSSLKSNIFTDWASGLQYDLAGKEVHNAEFLSAGVKLEMNFGPRINLNMVYAQPLNSSSSYQNRFRQQPFTFSLTARW